MANVTVSVNIDSGAIKSKIEAGELAMLIAVTEQFVEYANIFVRVDTGAMEDSSRTASIPEQGLAIWDTPYAKKTYYTGTPSRDVNPNASLQWAEKSKRTYKAELAKVAQNAFTKGFGK